MQKELMLRKSCSADAVVATVGFDQHVQNYVH